MRRFSLKSDCRAAEWTLRYRKSHRPTGGLTLDSFSDSGNNSNHAPGSAPGEPAERRRHRRFTVGVPVRLRTQGSATSAMIELSDVSFRGCRLRTLSDAGAPAINARVAFGFVMADRNIALAKGRVMRQVDEAQGGGIGLVIDRANVAFYEFLMTLAEGESSLAA